MALTGCHCRSHRAVRGTSLLEVLAAVLVIAAGVLGIARLQLHSAQGNRAALEHTTATILATDLIERWRANPQGRYATATGQAPPAFVDCLATTCGPPQLATFDLAAWKCSLGRWSEAASCRAARAAGALPPVEDAPGLPGGDGEVAEQGGNVVVTVTWRGAQAGRVALAVRR